MRRIYLKTKQFECEKCKTRRTSEREARKCESMPVEEKAFKVGDRVIAFEPRQCDVSHQQYTVKGRVRRIIGPVPADDEYERKWLGGRRERINSHVYLYEVGYPCPVCKRDKSWRYFTPEIRLALPSER